MVMEIFWEFSWFFRLDTAISPQKPDTLRYSSFASQGNQSTGRIAPTKSWTINYDEITILDELGSGAYGKKF